MKKILLFGAGKSATALINYLLQNAEEEAWHLTLVDANLQLAQSKLNYNPHSTAASFDIEDTENRKKYIAAADIVISLLPPHLHLLVAMDCIASKKNLLTASYIDEKLKGLQEEIKNAGLLFLCEMGLDPGIDHMSAKKGIDEIKEAGGEITSFQSHCGGLIATESDDNPWHYKISWNPRNVVMAGKGGAVYKQDNAIIQLKYEQLFMEKRGIFIPGYQMMCWYPNRDSLSYTSLYELDHCPTFIRTTLRHPDFIQGWKNAIHLHLTDEAPEYDTNGKSLMDFFKEHFQKGRFDKWLCYTMDPKSTHTKNSMNPDGSKRNIPISVNHEIEEDSLTLQQLLFLGMDDNQTIINRGKCSAAEVLQFALEKKLPLSQTDKDLVVMMHEIEYTKNKKNYKWRSTLLVKGENNQDTAMAKTVGLPLGIAAKLILKGIIHCKGLHIPVSREIYEPVLEELKKHGIIFKEEKSEAL
jgi:saccharopine dehydrogenase-like NADP-dependent oxidoreductase